MFQRWHKLNIIKIHEIDIPLFVCPSISVDCQNVHVNHSHSRPTSQVSTLILKRRGFGRWWWLVWIFPNFWKGSCWICFHGNKRVVSICFNAIFSEMSFVSKVYLIRIEALETMQYSWLIRDMLSSQPMNGWYWSVVIVDITPWGSLARQKLENLPRLDLPFNFADLSCRFTQNDVCIS